MKRIWQEILWWARYPHYALVYRITGRPWSHWGDPGHRGDSGG
jgi:hypothetical protein